MHMVFRSSLGGRNILTHGWEIWANPYENIDRGHHRRIRMDRI